MTTRRTVIKTLSALPPALAFDAGWAASPDPSRTALIVGNSSYRDAPLQNPAHDASAVARLLTQAGFSVDARLNARHADMLTAIDALGAAAKRPETKLIVFYYAGHGAQQDWRNYLIPVDAVVDTPEHLKQRCIDLNHLLIQLTAAKDKTFIIILDACRDNPFGNAFRLENKGLSQFDAPVGSLLAYATAPGKLAMDGVGENGLYTEHLVRELSKRGTRIEDALKRVRLNVRLASQGQQIPWETTSLESDVFIFKEDQRKLSDAELEKQVEVDIVEWTRIKASRKVDDWANYLRAFPNGRFAEIAQTRLSHLLAGIEKAQNLEQERRDALLATQLKKKTDEEKKREQKLLEFERIQQANRAPVAPVKPSAGLAEKEPQANPQVSPNKDALAIDIRAEAPTPILLKPSDNPNSAGRYPLGRVYTVGDEATYRVTDILTGVVEGTFMRRVTRVDYDNNRVEYNDGADVTDLMGNVIKRSASYSLPAREYEVPAQFTPAEFQIGKKWTAMYRRTLKSDGNALYFDMEISGREYVAVPAGRFEAFAIKGLGWNLTSGNRYQEAYWMVPGVNFFIKSEETSRNRTGQFRDSRRTELVALRQQVMGIG